ncbi:MAG: phosphoglycolate phosphatase [Pseudomonadales bacterium]|nr:phosphoglycolate phosphatase [Pseudomonadales bacterium]
MLFDLDGTLVDSVPDLTQAMNLAIAESNMQQPFCVSASLLKLWVGNGAERLVQRAHRYLATVLDPNAMPSCELLHRRFLYHYGHLSTAQKQSCLYDGVEQVLGKLTQAGIALAVVTNKPAQFTPALLSDLGIAKYFDVVVAGDSLPVKKPDPQPLLHALDCLRNKGHAVQIESALMVGDSKNDILAAKAANMASASVSYGYNHGESITEYNATLKLSALTELLL